MAGRTIIRRLAGDEQGATAVEFAMVLAPLCVLLLGLLDLTYQVYVRSAVQGTLFEAARLATVGNKTGEDIDDHVKGRLERFSDGGAIQIHKKSYYDFAGVRKPEVITQDIDPVGQYNPGDCFRDVNGNKAYDTDRGKGGLGGSDDIVDYEIELTYNRLVPVGTWFGMQDQITVTSSTPLRNQPFASRSAPQAEEICLPQS